MLFQRTCAIPLLAAVLALGCAAGGNKGRDGQGGAGGEGGAGGAGGSGPPPGCVDDSDCSMLDGPCTNGVCKDQTCEAAPAHELEPCSDGVYCTVNDVCRGGVCTAGNTRPCASPDACHVGVCDEAAQQCKSVPANEGGPCDDQDACTGEGQCLGGTCQKGKALDCSLFDGPCTEGVCDPAAGCKSIPANEGGACEDNLFCTVNDACHEGLCQGGGPNPCAKAGGCLVGTCDELADLCAYAPGPDGAACDDGNLCTAGETCAGGVCVGGAPANDGVSCDDGLACTTETTCGAGVCGGGSGARVYFLEDFSDNARGWKLGPEWEIGPSKSPGEFFFAADPAKDHTATDDNGVAGVVLGGNPDPSKTHPYYFLESPPFDTSGAPGKVTLGFWRWLNSDAAPAMRNAIQVFDGTSWQSVWVSLNMQPIVDAPPDGPGWTYFSYDLTPYKSAAMRLRFGFLVGQANVSFGYGSWTLDDVVVSDVACP
jgi:hypothetical protein